MKRRKQKNEKKCRFSMDKEVEQREPIFQKLSDEPGLKCKEKILCMVDWTSEDTVNIPDVSVYDDEVDTAMEKVYHNDTDDFQGTSATEMPTEAQETSVCNVDGDGNLSKWHSLVLEGKIEVLDWSSYKFTCTFEEKEIVIHLPDDLVMDYKCLQNHLQEESVIAYYLLVHSQCSSAVTNWLPVCGWCDKNRGRIFFFTNHKIFSFDKENDIICLITNNGGSFLYLRCESMYVYMFNEKRVLPIENYMHEQLHGTLHIVAESVPVSHWNGFPVKYRVHLLSADKYLAEAAVSFLLLGEVNNNPCVINLEITEDECVPRHVSEGMSSTEALPKMCYLRHIRALNDHVNLSFAVFIGFIRAVDKDGFQFTFYVKKKKLSCAVPEEAALDYCDCIEFFESCCLPFYLIVCNVNTDQRLSFLPVCGWFGRKSHDAYILHDLRILFYSSEEKIVIMEDQNNVVHFLHSNFFDMLNELNKVLIDTELKGDISLPLHVIVENIPLMQVKGYVARQQILFMSNNKELTFAALKFLVLGELDNEILDCESADEHVSVNCLDQNPFSSAKNCCLQNDVCSIQHKPGCKSACMQAIGNWETYHISSLEERSYLENRILNIDIPGDILPILQRYNELSREACKCLLGTTYFVPPQNFEVEYQMKRFVGQFRVITEDYGIISCRIKANDIVCHRSTVYIDGRSITSLLELKEEVFRNVSVIAVPLLEDITIQYRSSCARYVAAVAWYGKAPDLIGIHHCHNHRPTLFCVDRNNLCQCGGLCSSSEDEEAAFTCAKGRIIFNVGKYSLKGSGLKKVDVELDCIFTNEVTFYCKARKDLLWCPLSRIYISGERCESVYDVSKVKIFKCIYNMYSFQNMDGSEKKYCIIAYVKSGVIPGIHICEDHDGIILTKVKAREGAAAESDRFNREVMQDQSNKYLNCFRKDVAIRGRTSPVLIPEIKSGNHDSNRSRSNIGSIVVDDDNARVKPLQCEKNSTSPESLSQDLLFNIHLTDTKTERFLKCLHVEENFAILHSKKRKNRICAILLQEDFYLTCVDICPPEKFKDMMTGNQGYNGVFARMRQDLTINGQVVTHVAVVVFKVRKPSNFKQILFDLSRNPFKQLKVQSSCSRVPGPRVVAVPNRFPVNPIVNYTGDVSSDGTRQQVLPDSRESGKECVNTQQVNNVACNGMNSSSTRNKIDSAKSASLPEALRSLAGGFNQLEITCIRAMRISDLEYLVCNCVHVDDSFALLRSSKIIGIVLQEDFYITRSELCSLAEFKNKMIVKKSYDGIFTKMQHTLIIQDQLVTHVAVFAFIDEEPLYSEEMISHWKRNPVKWLRGQRSCIGKIERNPLTAPPETCGSQLARSTVDKRKERANIFKQCAWKHVVATGRIYKLKKKFGVLEAFSQSFENGRATVFFDESAVYIDKKRIPADRSFVDVLTPLQEGPWSCIARPFVKNKEKKKVIAGVEVEMITSLVWKGGKPSYDERKVADEEIALQILKTKFKSKVTKTSKKKPGNIFMGTVVACQECFGWLVNEEEAELFFERDTCFLYGITLCDVNLMQVLPVGTEVWFSLSADKLSIEKVWAGRYHHLARPDVVDKIREWCESLEVPESVADILLFEAGWLSPKFEPTIAVGDEKEVADIC